MLLEFLSRGGASFNIENFHRDGCVIFARARFFYKFMTRDHDNASVMKQFIDVSNSGSDQSPTPHLWVINYFTYNLYT